MRRVVQSADNALLFLQHEYETHGRVTERIVDFVDRAKRDPILNQIAVADARGDLILSAVPHDKPINISGREHFQVHAAGGTRRAVHRQARHHAGRRAPGRSS